MGNTLQKPQKIEVEEREHPQQEVLVSNFTCEICIEPMLSNRKFKNGSLCTHSFCLDCITKYIEVKVEDYTSKINCPALNCEHTLDPLSCRPVTSKLLFERWCDLLCDSKVLELENCYCPYCRTVVLNECRDKPKKTDCPNCKKSFCFQCKIPWHAGYRCNESEELRDMNDSLIGELIEREQWTRCYNCGHSVERVDGCRVITCRCGVKFCYQCGGQIHFGACDRERCSSRGALCFLFALAMFVLVMFIPFIVPLFVSRKGSQ